MKRIHVFAAALIFSVSAMQAQKVRNVVFLIGDGMGLPQVTAALRANNNHLNFERLPYLGLSKTYSASHIVTDSGAGGTALSSGCKTNNRMVGMNADSVAVNSILTEAQHHGMSTGVVVTCEVTHATPASFIAHNISRKNYEEIAVDVAHSNVDVLVGGGRIYFDQRKSDGQNLIDTLRQQGYDVVSTIEGMKQSQGRVAGFLTDPSWPAPESGDPWPEAKVRGRLEGEAVSIALDKLSKNKKGFFLMVEGSFIDWACHSNDYDQLIDEMLDFDDVIGRVLDFAERDGHTLVVITADHETGGLSLPANKQDNTVFNPNFSTKSHTGCMVPIYAYGPGAEIFCGIQENTALRAKMEKLLRW